MFPPTRWSSFVHPAGLLVLKTMMFPLAESTADNIAVTREKHLRIRLSSIQSYKVADVLIVEFFPGFYPRACLICRTAKNPWRIKPISHRQEVTEHLPGLVVFFGAALIGRNGHRKLILILMRPHRRNAKPICLRLLTQCNLRGPALSDPARGGRRSSTSSTIATSTITTSSKVNADFFRLEFLVFMQLRNNSFPEPCPISPTMELPFHNSNYERDGLSLEADSPRVFIAQPAQPVPIESPED